MTLKCNSNMEEFAAYAANTFYFLRLPNILIIQGGDLEMHSDMEEFAAYAANTFLLTLAPKHPNNSRR